MKKLVLAVSIVSVLFNQSAYAAGSESQQGEPLPPASIPDIADTILTASPEAIINVRKQIIRNSAAQRVPVLETFDDIAEPLLDIEETFEITSEPSSKTPTINIARYMSTSVNFVDAYGNPWPIRKVVNFLEGLVQVERISDATPTAEGESGKGGSGGIDPLDPQAGSFALTSSKHGATGNLTVYLVNRSTPVTIMLEGKSGVFHKEATVKLTEVGPQTDLAKINRSDEVVVGTKADSDLNNALYGVGPIGSTAMVVEGGEGRVWVKGNVMYMQTPLSVFSPKVVGASHANGRYRAYKLPASTVVMASNGEGKTVTLKVKRIAQSDVMAEVANGSGH
ncbi:MULTISPECIES: DotH/IcmK family type IV secretion protein [Pseudomonas]|uniref:DotH/IcmK family type IV secretion protein n=1 Tax=Pseudomonas TaxID=286 RepID=UPI001474AC9F|nr:MULTISPECIES: DotH/IcmK family type IV secretion protein [Pseudomonas]MEC4242112.1 DotH/IcmK family type IV secretion protein [Pseudomonas sp. DSV-1]NNB34032.1 hypothetical protein [Pseudomonas fragi]